MNPEQQRIKIAEACGYEPNCVDGCWVLNKSHFTIRGGSGTDKLPDYLNDLNAMHEAEKVLNEDQKSEWTECVTDILGMDQVGYDMDSSRFRYAHLNAGQRAEAFLKTLGLWKAEASNLNKSASDTAQPLTQGKL